MRTHLPEFFTAPLGPPAVVAMRAAYGPRPLHPRLIIRPPVPPVWRSRRHERFPLHAQSWAELEPEAAAQRQGPRHPRPRTQPDALTR